MFFLLLFELRKIVDFYKRILVIGKINYFILNMFIDIVVYIFRKKVWLDFDLFLWVVFFFILVE